MSNNLLKLIGGALGGYVAWKLVAPEIAQRNPSRFLAGADANATALITGASAGIGEAYARRLAREGYNVVLVARRQEKLTMLAADLHKRHAVDAQIVAADLAKPDDIAHVADVVTDLSEAGKLDLLINNAGFGTVGGFADVPLDEHLDMLNVHMTASMQLTRAALPGMLQRRRGGIINVSSVASWYPLPGNVNYSASKRFLVTFTEALQTELVGSGVAVQALCPGFTYSEFHDTTEFRNAGFRRENYPAFMWQTADQVVEASLNQLGGEVVCVPGVHNRVLLMMRGVREMLPASAVRRLRQSYQGSQTTS
jgi:short-subunit dehydrogenase